MKSLIKDLARHGDTYAVSELRQDLRNRFPIRVWRKESPTRSPPAWPTKSRNTSCRGREAQGRGGEIARPGRRPPGGPRQGRNGQARGDDRRDRKVCSHAVQVTDAVQYAQDVMALQIKDRNFVPLVQTASEVGRHGPRGPDLAALRRLEGRREELSPFRSLFYQPSDNQQYVLAAHIQGHARGCGRRGPINVVLVADAEMVSDVFFRWREQGSIPGQDIVFDFDNITFALNALDALAGDDRFLEIRKAGPSTARWNASTSIPARPARKAPGWRGEEQGARRQHQEGDQTGRSQGEGDRLAKREAGTGT